VYAAGSDFMQTEAERLPAQLKAQLAPVYLVHGDEPLLIEEACDRVRAAAREQGYDERVVLNVDRDFDWSRFVEATQSMSLFSSRKLVELRIPTGRPGDAGGKALTQYAQAPVPDTVVLVIAGRLESAVRNSKWLKQVEAAGMLVACRPVDERRLPQWIEGRMRQRGLRAGPGVVAALIHYLQGNLLAVVQEIEKLALLCPDGAVDVAAVEASVADSARFDVFALIDTCLAGDAPKAVRVLGSLRAEGVEPVLVVWALVREVRSITPMAAELAAGRPQAQVLRSHRVWSSRAPVVGKALQRLRYPQWLGLVRRAAELDRIVKGRRTGAPWLEIERFCLGLCGLPSLSAVAS
jgi:DNA polymerase-3 subunit delta